MAEYIFNSGSCLKKDVYPTIINLMKNAGWTDISTNPITDFNIMMSPGETGDKRLIVQMRPLPINGTASQNVTTSDYHMASLRLISNYVQNTGGVQGSYLVTVGTATTSFDAVGITYSTSGNGTTSWKDTTQLASCINYNATLKVKYTASVVSATQIRLVQNQYYETPTAPVIGGTGASLAATEIVGAVSSGIIERDAETWRYINLEPAISSALLPKDTTMVSYKYHVNKNRIIIALEYLPATNLGSSLIYLGLPDETYCSETGSKGLLYMCSTYNEAGATTALVTDNSAESSAATTAVTRAIQCTLAQKNPNAAGKYMLSEMFYGNSADGIRGKITGLYVMPNQGVLAGDIIMIGAKQFYVVICGVYSNSAFPSAAIAIQVA